MFIPIDAIRNTCDYLPLDNIYRLDHDLLSRSKKEELHEALQYIHQYFPTPLIDLFTIKILLTAHRLEWKHSFLGGTGYIDRIKPQDLKNPISIGRDEFDRSFICLKIRNLSKNEIYVLTLFQRYSDDPNTWTMGCHSYYNFTKSPGYFLTSNIIRHKYFEDNMKKLLSMKNVSLQISEEEYGEFELMN